MRQDNECFAPLWARHNGFSELDLTRAVCSQKELSRRLQGHHEVDYVAANRMVKYLCGTRDTVSQLMPRKGTLRLDSASDSDWAGCPTSRKSSSRAMVWLSGALVNSLCKTQGLIALSTPEAEQGNGRCDDAATLVECVVTVGLGVSPGCASQNVTRAIKKILMHSTDSEVFQCRAHHEHATQEKSTETRCEGW